MSETVMSETTILPITVEVAVQQATPETEQESVAELVSGDVSDQTWEDWFTCWLNALQPRLSSTQSYELGLRLTNDAEIQSLNAQYRQKDQPTDVLAFAALEVDYPQPEESTDPLYLGDLVISLDTAQKQAEERGHLLREELAWLAAHGLLHLLGWDHPDEESLQDMLHQQEALLQTIGLSLSYDD